MKLISALLVLLFISCLTTDQIQNQTSVNETIEKKPEVDLKLEEQWKKINEDNVEDYCLDGARDYAADEGHPTWAIFSCRCDEDASEDVKHYDCRISAADGSHYTQITCYKSTETCTLQSEAGLEEYTFDYLEELD